LMRLYLPAQQLLSKKIVNFSTDGTTRLDNQAPHGKNCTPIDSILSIEFNELSDFA